MFGTTAQDWFQHRQWNQSEYNSIHQYAQMRQRNDNASSSLTPTPTVTHQFGIAPAVVNYQQLSSDSGTGNDLSPDSALQSTDTGAVVSCIDVHQSVASFIHIKFQIPDNMEMTAEPG